MRRLLIVPLLLCLSACASLDMRYEERMANRVQSSIVHITEETQNEPNGVCTGIVLAPDRVLTAAHCLGDAVQADGRTAIVLKSDAFYDLALLNVVTVRPILPMAVDTVVRGEYVSAFGYGWGWDHLTMLTCRVVLVDFSPNPKMPVGIFTQGGYIPGMSGGPVVNADGELVGIVQQTNGNIGYGVGAVLIRAFLLGSD